MHPKRFVSNFWGAVHFPKGKEHNVNGFVYEWTFVLS